MKIIAAALALTAAGLSAVPAVALSCLRPDPVRIYTQARDAEARYRIVHGTLTAQETVRRKRPAPGSQATPKPVRVKARLQGMQLGRGGFATPIDTPVTVVLTCAASWCGGWPGAGQLLMAVQETSGGLSVESDACSSQIYSKPTRADLGRVLTCHKGGACATDMR
ncbi:MAG: hypothetical protein JXQ91_08795 [Vannielia sp.]|uniref:hypothetical protein n=1 Tax=Vannielia sp. TaxID=2813045 RepID=UPI003B8BD98A